jgi:hypothetical protein
VSRSCRPPSGLGCRFGPPPQVGKLVSDRCELLGEVGAIGAAFGELLHADALCTEGAAVRLVEDLAGVAGGGRGTDRAGVQVGQVQGDTVVLPGGGGLVGPQRWRAYASTVTGSGSRPASTTRRMVS